MELPRLVPLCDHIILACFSLMKLLPARCMLDNAEDEGTLVPGGVVCESTSGTFGLALAMMCCGRGYQLKLFSDPAIDAHLFSRLREMGADVDIAHNSNGLNFQGERLKRLDTFLENNPHAFWPRQYDNPENPASYSRVVEFLMERVGRIDCFVASVGSGGSLSGTGKILREIYPDVHIIAVDTPGSVLFGQPDAKRTLRGLGNSIMPRNLDHTLVDEVHWVDAFSAFRETRRLHREHGLFLGPTSGAASLCARWWNAANPGCVTVAYMPDEGTRYQDTVYNDEWLSELDGWGKAGSNEPRDTDDNTQLAMGWTRYDWRRAKIPSAASVRLAS